MTILGRTGEAEELAERSLAIAERHYGRDHPLFANCVQLIAQLEYKAGELHHAKDLYEQSLEVLERSYGARHPSLLRGLQSYSWLLYAMWELPASRRAHERAIEIIAGFFGPGDPRAGWMLNGYGNLLKRMGDLDGAERAFVDVITLAESMDEPSPYLLAAGMVNLGTVVQDRGRLREAIELYEGAFPLLAEVFEEDNPTILESKLVYAGALSRAGQHLEARQILEHVLQRREAIFGPDDYRVAAALGSLAGALVRAGDVLGALEYRRRALAIHEQVFGAEGYVVGLSHNNIARDLLSLGRLDDAYEHARRAERIRRSSLRVTVSSLPERHALDVVRNARSGVEVMITVDLRRQREDERIDARSTWDEVVRSRAIVLDELASRHRSFDAAGVSPELVAEVRSARQRLANRIVRGRGDDHLAQLHEARVEKERAEGELATQSEEFRRMRRATEVGLSDVEQMLPEDGALVAYVRFRDAGPTRGEVGSGGRGAYAAFVRSPNNDRVRLVTLGVAEAIDRLVEDWRSAVSTRPPAFRSSVEEQAAGYDDAAIALREAVWDPVADGLDGARLVFVVPDGALGLVNLATLRAEDGRFLLEHDVRIQYLSTERDLARETVGVRDLGLLAVGGPDFDVSPRLPDISALEDAEPVLASIARASSGDRFRGIHSSCSSFHEMRFEPLPAAAKEIDDITGLWSARDGRQDVLRLTGKLARETWIKQQVSERSQVHIATHGFFLKEDCVAENDPVSRENPLLRSGLALAGANRHEEAGELDDDGILTAEEVASLDLAGVEWVVLSGCDTGSGKVVAGEGVLGLRRAFRIAGARTLVMSLWKVEDDATRRWMQALYAARLDGASTPDAIRRAALQVLLEHRDAGLPDHPFYWGAFVAAGDWR